MSTAAQDALSEGLAALDTELGQSYVLAASGVAFVARIERGREQVLPDYSGTIRETVLHVQRAALPATIPAVGSIITLPVGSSARLARVDPGEFPGMLILVLADEIL